MKSTSILFALIQCLLLLSSSVAGQITTAAIPRRGSNLRLSPKNLQSLPLGASVNALSAVVPRATAATTAGTTNAIAKFASPTALLDSVIFENAGKVGIGTNSPSQTLDVAGTLMLRANSTANPGLFLGDATGASSVFIGQNGAASGSNFGVMHGGAWRFTITQSGLVGVGTSTPSALLEVAGDLKLSSGGRLLFPDGSSLTSALTSGNAVLAGNNAFTGQQFFTWNSDTDPVITVTNSATSGSAYGARFESDSGDGVAVLALSTGLAGAGTALSGRTASSQGAGVIGNALSTTGANFGAIGISNSTLGTGVKGQALATTGTTYGVYGSTAGDSSAAGVYGISTSTQQQSSTYGIYGATRGAYGVGVFGYSTSTAGTPFGVFGRVDSSGGIAGQFTNTASTGNVLAASNANGRVFRVDTSGNIYMSGTVHTGGADFAELVEAAPSLDQYTPGDLLVIDEQNDRRVRISSEPYSTAVIGIYSAKPGVLGSTRAMTDGTSSEVPVAMIGIVPCKASTENGPIRRGDLLVSSSTPGYVMKGTDRMLMTGAIVGKALQPLESGQGVIEIAVTLQ